MEVEQSFDNRALVNYLKVRGLPTDTLTLSCAGIEFAGPRRCREALGLRADSYDKRLGIIFHYPGSTYSTVRWFGKYIGPFGTVVDRKAEAPSGVPTEAYLSPLVEWGDYDEGTLYICESVLKALVVSLSGRFAVAGSGVWGLLPKGQLLLPDALRERTKRVVILFDNDWKRNAQVRASIRRLGGEIKARWGCEVVHGQIPDPPAGSFYWDVERGKDAGKWGIDDAFATLGESVYSGVVEAGIEPTERELALDEFNERYAVCAHPPCIISVATGHKYSRPDFIGLLEAHRRVWEDGKSLEISKLWLSYEERTLVERVDYMPGSERISGGCYNEWRDDGAPPCDGDVTPFLRVYENAVPDDEVRSLLLRSFAWMLQNRGTKLDKSFIFVGRQVGTGKSLLAKTMGEVFGMGNFASIGVEDFSSDFNSAFAAKEVVLVDDLHRMGVREVAKLKRYTTATTIVVNTKNVKQYTIRNTAVFIITTNEYAAVSMDDVERRNLVVAFDPVEHHVTGDGYWSEYVEWLEDGGYGKIRRWLEELPLDGFDPQFMPPMTATKQKMIAMGRDDVDNNVLDLWNDPDSVLGANKRSVYSTDEIWFLMYGNVASSGDRIVLGRALANKFDQAHGGKLARFFEGGGTCRVWVIRNRDKKWDLAAAKKDIGLFRTVAS